MALIHVFDGINKHTSYTFNGKLKDHIKNVDWENSVILKGGYRIDENYEVQPDDVLYIRKVPAAAVSDTTLAWKAVGAAVTAIAGAGVAVGVSIYNNKEAMAAMEDAQKASKAAAETSGKLPFVKGARNQAATGRSFPYAIGESLMTPYRLCPPHYTIAGTTGDEQYYNVVLEVAYNNILVKKIKMGETIIKDFSGVSAPQNGQYAFDAGVYYDARSLIEIRQTGAFTDPEFNKKVVLTELSEEIPHEHASGDPTENERIEKEWKAGVVQELASHAQAVELIALFDGLQQYDDGWKSQTITLKPQWANVSNPSESDWHDFTNGFNQNGSYNNTFTYNTKKQMRYVARQEFTAAQAFNKNMKVRVIRTTPKADSSAKDSVYLLAVQTYCYDAKKSSSSQLVAADVLEPTERDKCCRIGVRVAANVNATGLLDAISVIESGCARTWNGTAWSSAKTPTRNLAAWVLELMTSPHHRPSKYDDAELDLASFGAWYTYCQQQGFNADGVITKNAKKKQTIETLCKNGNAALVYNSMTGKIEVAIDNGRDYSIALLNSENIISISTTKEFKRKITGKKVTYINAAAGYDADSVIFMRDGEAYDPATDTLTETALEYVTDYTHAFKYVWRQMAEEIAQPKIYMVKAGLESAYYPIYSRVELQHKSLKIGIAHGVIKACIWYGGLLREIHLDGAVTFPATGACGVIINCVSDSGRGLLALKVSGTGKTNILHVETTLRNNAALIPTAGNALSFGKLDINGEFTTVTSTCKITNAEESDNGYTLTLVDYNPALYQYGALPEYRSNLTSVPNGKTQTVEEQRDYITKGESEANAAGAAQVVSDEITKGTRFTNIYKIRPVDMSLEDVIKKMDDDARNASASISMSADEILLQVQSLDEQQRAFIAITKDQILAQVDDMAQELTGLIDIQAGAVTALVEGGGAQGQMSLSLELPVMIDATTRAKFVQAASEGEVSAVYATLAGTSGENVKYAIKGNASNAAVKALWDKAVAAALIASQIDLTATQINIAAEHVVIAGSTNHGQTIIEGGKIRAALIEVEDLLAKNVELKNGGSLRSNNFDGTINNNGQITADGTNGWAVDNAGKVIFNNAKIRGEINATTGTLDNVTVNGFYTSNNTPFQPMAMINIGYNNGTLQLTNNKNIKSVTRNETGVFTLSLKKGVWLKTHSYNGYDYIDVFAIGNAADTFDAGFKNMLLMTPNWLRNYVNGRLTQNNGYAYVDYVILYFTDNNSDQLIDPKSAQCFIFGTESD
nr:MAG TPA: Fibronectin type III protein [Caudoviricetes sp.]